MRKVGLYLVALCTGSFAVGLYWAVVGQLFGVVAGAAAIAVTVGGLALLVLTTASVFAVLAVPKPRPARARVDR